MKTVILDGYTENPGDLSWEGFGRFGEFEVYERTKNEDIVSRIGDAQVVYTNKTPITEDIIGRIYFPKIIIEFINRYVVLKLDRRPSFSPFCS